MVVETILQYALSPYILVTTLVVLVITYLWYSYGVKPYSFFKDRGIDGPPPKAFVGSLGDLAKYQDRPLDSYADFLKKYGRTYGIFMGWTPFLVTVDPEMIKQIFVRNFDKFPQRMGRRGIFSPKYEGKVHDQLTTAKGEDWRRRRRILSPAFSGLKMRMMEPLIKESTLRLAAKISEFASTGESVDVLSLYSKFTMEVILSVGFGRSLDVQNGKGGELYEAACAVFRGFSGKEGKTLQMMGTVSFIFPFLNPILEKIADRTKVGKAMQFVTSAAEEIVKIRREQGGDPNRKDLLQLMIDASDEESHDSLSTGEIITDSMTFMLAGYETSSNFLMFASYLLALNPEIQEKLFQSISLYMEENSGKSMYDACNEIEYLDMVANEVFRVYPPGYLIIRNCVEPCTVEGMRFEKGNTIFVPVYNLHRDEEIWPEPEKFDPDRFLPSVAEKRHPCSHLPFGFGPRNCVGMRLAILESKMALMEVISKYRIVVSPETEVPLELKVAITLTVKEGLFLKFESRSISEE